MLFRVKSIFVDQAIINISNDLCILLLFTIFQEAQIDNFIMRLVNRLVCRQWEPHFCSKMFHNSVKLVNWLDYAEGARNAE